LDQSEKLVIPSMKNCRLLPPGRTKVETLNPSNLVA
jgi:hypothetical protein